MFDLYLIKSFEKYILSIINIEASNWMLLIILALVNWGRVELGIYSSDNCGGSTPCKDFNDIKVFTIIGKKSTIVLYNLSS